MARSEAREYVSMECTACGSRNYRTQKRAKGQTYKVEVQKFCSRCRRHELHKEKKK
jgi:large subunit ribosomal protein L33